METRTFTLSSGYDGLQLSVCVTRPEGSPRGTVQIVHGMIEHKERYYPLMEWLSEQGFACIVSDLRGHGASVRKSEDLGYFGKGGWLALVEDVKTVRDFAAGEFGRIPYILLGHSMGSLIVRSYIKRYDSSIDCLIVSGSPSDNPAKGAGKALAKALQFLLGPRHRSGLLQKISFAGYNSAFKSDGYDRAWVCSDPQILECYHKDPLCSFTFTADGFINLFELMSDCYSGEGWHLTNPDLPIRFISGSLDPCRISDKAWMASMDFLSGLGFRDVDGRLYPSMRHETLNETDRMTVWSDVLSIILSVPPSRC